MSAPEHVVAAAGGGGVYLEPSSAARVYLPGGPDAGVVEGPLVWLRTRYPGATPTGEMALHLDREGAAALRDALTRWLEENL